MICETIPSEILCEIFLLLCDKPISLHVLDNSSCFGEFPWAVEQVCKRWRVVFLSYPHLWTSLFLQCPPPTNILSVDRLHEINRRTLLYLERSKHLPLTITVYNKYRTWNIANFPRTTWKLLLSCSERWETVDLVLRYKSPVLDLLRCKMPIIKSLRLHDYRASYFKLYHPFSAAPRLTELILYGWFIGWVFPWSQLTKLKVSFTSFGDRIESEELETILSQLRNLEELHVDEVFVWHRNDDGDRRSIRLASLRLLAVRTYPLDILTRIE